MSNIGSYDERVKNFNWSIAEKELGYKPGDVINIGWYCTDRICQQGKGDKVALYLGGLHRRREDLHLQRHPPGHEHHRRLPPRPRHQARGAGLPVHGPASPSSTSASWAS